MQIGKIVKPFLAAIIISGCSRENRQLLTDHPPGDCVIQSSPAAGRVISGQYIIALNPFLAARSASEQELAGIGRDILKRNNIGPTSLLQAFSGEPSGFIARLNDQEVLRLQKEPMIIAVERDRVVALDHCFNIVEPRLVTWNIHRVGFGEGTGKTAWIIDSGIDFDHPDLVTDKNRSRSFITGNTSADDENGHGTHVAGIIGAKNNTVGTLGVASGATLISLRVLNEKGEGVLSSIIQALAYINTAARAGDVVNMSVGGDEVSEILDQQVRNTAARGIFISIAAGNEGKAASAFSPGRVNGNNIYTVSAVDSLDRFASFSNYGNEAVDFAAPGVHILSAWINGKYALASGTSMAAPHVAGLLLLKGKGISASGFAINDPDGMPDRIAHY